MSSRKKVMFCAILSIAVCFSCVTVIYAQDSSSQKLIGVLPDDVLFFATTSGGDALKSDFEKTVLGRVWNEPSVKTFYQTIEKSLMEKAQSESDISEAAGYVNMVKSIVGLVGSRPIIIGAAQKETEDGPPIYGFAIMDAGTKKDAISGILSNLEAMAGKDEIVDVKVGSNTFHGPKDAGDVPGYWGWVGNYFVFAINDGDGLAIKYLNRKIKRELPNYFQKSSVTNDALAVYLNIEKVFNMVKTFAKMEGEDEDFAVIEDVISRLGLDKFRTVSSRVGFKGNGIIVDELVGVSQPLTGLLASLKPINLDMFNMVGSNAVSVTALNVNLAGIYDTVFNTIKTVAGDEFAEVEQGIAQMENQMQFKIRDGLLESLNGKILFYETPTATLMQPGFVIVLGLRDAQLWKDSITSISNLAVAMSDGKVQINTQEINGRTFKTIGNAALALAQVMPTWTIVGDNVVIGLSPAICTAAADQAAPAARAQSIRNNENFKKVTANLPSNLIYFNYMDSKVQITQLMAVLQQFWPMATVFISEQMDITLPMFVPNLTQIIEDITPSVQYSWLDEQGIHSIYEGSGIEPSLGAIAGGALFTGITMPAITKARGQAKQIVSRNNLKQLSLASNMYAVDNADKFPDNFDQLKKYIPNDKVLESPLKPAGFNGPCYIYVPGHSMKDKNPASSILIYENPQYCSDKINAAFLDGHVDTLTRANFTERLKATYGQLGKPMPEIKFKD